MRRDMAGRRSSEYNVYSTFQSHEAEFDYLKSLEIEEKVSQTSPYPLTIATKYW